MAKLPRLPYSNDTMVMHDIVQAEALRWQAINGPGTEDKCLDRLSNCDSTLRVQHSGVNAVYRVFYTGVGRRTKTQTLTVTPR